MNRRICTTVTAIAAASLTACSPESTGSSGLSPLTAISQPSTHAAISPNAAPPGISAPATHDPIAAQTPAEQLTVAPDHAGRQWAPAASAEITPGVQTYTHDAQCTTNFVFTDDAGNTYIGQAAHCAGTGVANQTNGCTAGSLPLGTPVTFNRFGTPLSEGVVLASGELAYSSWLTMEQLGETDANACAYNDFALVKIHPEDVSRVNPSVPFWGGPVDLNTTGSAAGDTVHGYGNSSLRLGIPVLSPHTGIGRADDPAADGWAHTLTAPRPGVPGDSGSAFLDSQGRALGTLSTLALSLPVVNTIGDLEHELTYARQHSGIAGLTLVLGTEPYKPA